ncbi:thioesterase II family protein [Rugamonas sp. CCM 8940]|uniref:thioesterase II family protein n=1 Tax=Rugamonas sp. CCM 8940 TaxID=2765359 RepID=UPI00361D9F3E
MIRPPPAPPTSRYQSPWALRFGHPGAQPRLRLFCFPYAGGDANLYRDWAAGLPEQVEVVGVQYPGRGMHADAPISDCATLVRRLHAALTPLLDLPFVFFGHSNGALISYELARRLDGAQTARHRHHFVSARHAPQLPRTGAPSAGSNGTTSSPRSPSSAPPRATFSTTGRWSIFCCQGCAPISPWAKTTASPGAAPALRRQCAVWNAGRAGGRPP